VRLRDHLTGDRPATSGRRGPAGAAPAGDPV